MNHLTDEDLEALAWGFDADPGRHADACAECRARRERFAAEASLLSDALRGSSAAVPAIRLPAPAPRDRLRWTLAAAALLLLSVAVVRISAPSPSGGAEESIQSLRRELADLRRNVGPAAPAADGSGVLARALWDQSEVELRDLWADLGGAGVDVDSLVSAYREEAYGVVEEFADGMLGTDGLPREVRPDRRRAMESRLASVAGAGRVDEALSILRGAMDRAVDREVARLCAPLAPEEARTLASRARDLMSGRSDLALLPTAVRDYVLAVELTDPANVARLGVDLPSASCAAVERSAAAEREVLASSRVWLRERYASDSYDSGRTP